MNDSKVLVVVSGGLDSATCLGAAIQKFGRENVYALSFDYGQRLKKELESAFLLGRHYEILDIDGETHHFIHKNDLTKIGGSALTDNIDVPEEGYDGGIPDTYVLGRNTIFIAMALAYAERFNCDEVWVGVNSLDYSGYPDCRPEYIDAWNMLAELSSKRAVEEKPIRIVAPLLFMTKKEIISWGREMGVPYHLTWSCYNGRDLPCGKCDSCRFRRQAFLDNDIRDPLVYEDEVEK